jgi:hypothetical protein
MRNFV